MKAIVTDRQGSSAVVRMGEVERPIPASNEVSVKVRSATVTRGDVILLNMHPLLFIPLRIFGLRRKKTPGHEFAGVVEAVGGGVSCFKPGDKVFGTTTGLSVGANAEYVSVPERSKSGVLAKIPENLSYDEAATLPVGGMTALYLLQMADILPGQKVLIYGASGSVGTYAVQLAKNYFKAEVTGLCSTGNVALVKSLGADLVVDYKTEDITQICQKFNVIFDAVGKASPDAMKQVLAVNGKQISIRRTTKESMENLQILIDLVEQGKLKPVIDRRYPLIETPEAHRYVETGHKKGNVVIKVME